MSSITFRERPWSRVELVSMDGQCDDLTDLGLDLGFSSHSHFSAAFRAAYGRTPSAFRQAALRR